jgi:AmiR/NasT family two-component response regulator
MGNTECIGTLDLHRANEHAWTEHEVATARVFTDIATAYVLQASQHAREQRTIEQLQHALNSRVIIEQAKGVLAAERKISVDHAFALLRKHANDRNVTLRAVADAVVNLGLRP